MKDGSSPKFGLYRKDVLPLNKTHLHIYNNSRPDGLPKAADREGGIFAPVQAGTGSGSQAGALVSVCHAAPAKQGRRSIAMGYRAFFNSYYERAEYRTPDNVPASRSAFFTQANSLFKIN
ncbi:MAG: hypothetical protein LBR49_05175 [Tannerella sp.]|nr:hypothetical protein [Tannerella sp.]